MATIRGTNARNILRGSAAKDSIFGFLGNDDLYGRAGDDILAGDAGTDKLYGEAGNDQLHGGAGADRLDGGLGTDWALYLNGATAGVHINLVTHTGAGGAATGDRLFSIENVQGTKFNDVLTGDNFTNVLDTGLGNDTVNGGAGNDTLNGGGGTDTINGGTGDDLLIGGLGADRLDGGTGVDWALYLNGATAGVSINLLTHVGSGGAAAGDRFYNIENVQGTKFDDVLTGDGLANELNGDLGNDTLEGGAGSDTLIGGAGDDILTDSDTASAADQDVFRPGTGSDTITGDGNDVLDYRDATSGVILDLTKTTIANLLNGTGGFAAGDTFTGINSAYGGSFADTIVLGTGFGGIVYGFGGNDNLTLLGLLQRAIGGDGIDTIVLKGSNQTADGQAGDDILDASQSTGSATLNGGDGTDTLTGGASNDFLNGGAGADILDGGAGNSDWANYREGATAGITINLLSHEAGIGGTAQGDTLTRIENLQGTRFVDVLTGDANNNILSGGEGADVLDGGAGTGDWAYYNEGTTVGVTVNLMSGSASDADTLTGIENVLGSIFNDTLTGDSSANQLDGNDGDDVINGGGGADILVGGNGNDTLNGALSTVAVILQGGNGIDTLTGGSAADSLSGGADGDTLIGGGGADNMFGDAGNDTLDATASVDAKLRGGDGNDTLIGNNSARDYFYFENLTGTDTITNFLRANGDVLVVDLSVFSLGASFSAAELVNSAGHVASGAIAQFIYDTNSQQLWFDADGSGATNAAIHIATLTGGPASLLLSDFAVIE
jgi:Ca2+-binding RTX toxin-like protein